jgi:LemA protein
MVFGYQVKPNFTVENEKEISKPPQVDFGPAPAKPQGEAQGAAQ